MMNLQTTGESVKFCWDYYDFTGDKEFLREVGYPLIKDAARRTEGFCIWSLQEKSTNIKKLCHYGKNSIKNHIGYNAFCICLY